MNIDSPPFRWGGSVLALVAAIAACGSLWAEDPFPVVTVVNAKTIAGRPVATDSKGKLLPWPMPDNIGYSYSSHVLTQWSILWDQYNRQRYYDFHCCFDFDRTTYEMQPDFHWANSTGYLRAMMQGFMERLYPYTGDRNNIVFLADLIDYELENGLTPADYVWARVPYASANPGDRRYTGWSSHGEDFIEPHVVGEDGYGYLRFYEMTGNTKYLQAAIRCADALVKNYKTGDAANSPWPVRCYARDGKLRAPGMGPYSANVVEPVMLFDELLRLGEGDVEGYKKTREGAWTWLHQYPMKNNVWVGYFEDVPPRMENMNQVIPLEYARYVLLHPDKDPDWKENARKLIEWVKTTPKWPKYEVHGATVTTEQGDGKSFCCGVPNECCDSHTSRLAAVEALYYAKTGDAAYREAAFRSYNWVTYYQGMPENAHTPFGNQWWFTDEFSDGPRRLMDGFWAVPEWSPADESHLVGSISAVTKITYGKGSVTYSTFDNSSDDVLRLNFAPDSVWSGGHPLKRVSELAGGEGYTLDDSTRVLRIRHLSRDVDIQGKSDDSPVVNVDFDNPHLGGRVELHGEYPSGAIDWGNGAWRTITPGGRLSTFGVSTADQAAKSVTFRFSYPRVFLQFDAYNPTDNNITLTVTAPEIQKIVFELKPGELRRFKTGWMNRASQVTFDAEKLGALRFDNFGYSTALWTRLDWSE
jgi:hypothetical protein